MCIVAIYGVLNQIVEYRFMIEKNTRQPICPKIKKIIPNQKYRKPAHLCRRQLNGRR